MSSSNSFEQGQGAEIGKVLGPSKYIQIKQEMIDQFAKATHDLDPMHIDPDWCKENSPYGTTISFGFLTMSLLTAFAHDLLRYDREERDGNKGFPLNYGFNKMRLMSPIPVDAWVSATLKLAKQEQRNQQQTLHTYDVVINIENQMKPALVGEWLALWVSE